MLKITNACLSIDGDDVVMVGDFEFKTKKVREEGLEGFAHLGAQIMAVLLKTKMEAIREKVDNGGLHSLFAYDMIGGLQVELAKCEEMVDGCCGDNG